MNEKIKQLAEQSNLWAMLDKYSCEFSNANPAQDCGIELEKFAKLIVASVVTELEDAKKCDPYTGELLACEKNTILTEQIEWLQEYFEFN